MYNPYAQQSQNTPQNGGTAAAPGFSNPNMRAQGRNQFNAPNNMNYNNAQQPNNAAQPNQPNFNNFLSDPAAQMGLHFSQSALSASQQYMQQNLSQFVSDENIKYYFKVSNSYVFHKLGLIAFPYRNKSWIRQFRTTTDAQGNTVDIYATPIDDVNAPDLYIPSMSLMTYILVWAILSGFEGEFHPQLLGYALTRTIAYYIVDVLLLKISFYALGIETKKAKIWDLISYSGYKFVTVLPLMLAKKSSSSYMLTAAVFFTLIFSLGFFLMRSLRYVVLPTGMEGGNISIGSKRLRTQFLFLYAFVIQAVIVWLMA